MQQKQEKECLKKEENVEPSLRSLSVPWAVMVTLAIAAAVYTSHPCSSSAPDNNSMEIPESLSSAASTVQSWLQEAHRTLSSSLDDKPDKYTFEEDHPPLLPLSASDYAGVVCAVLGLMVAAGGGIGGGGILVPIYILVMGFSPKHAIPLSNVTVFGGAVANVFLNSKKRHPLVDRPLVDWDLILVMEPLTIAGALIGAFLNKILPDIFLVVMLVALLSFTAYNTLKKAIKMYRIESRHMREQAESELVKITHEEDEDDEEEAEEKLLENMETQEDEATPGSNDDSEKPPEDMMEDVAIYPTKNEELQQILDEERTTPKSNVQVLVVMFVVVLFINLMKGGGAFKSPLGIKCGSMSFWIANGLMIGWILYISMYARNYLVKRYEIKKRVGYEYVEGDIEWDGRATVVYPIVCAAAGFFAGMFGVGGGIVKGPLMLAMGVHPAVSSATSACMILFTSFTATTSFIVFGLLLPDYAMVCVVIGFLATLVGQIVLNRLMKKYNRNSYIAFSIGAVVLLSAFLMTIQSLVSIAEGGKEGGSGGICGKSD